MIAPPGCGKTELLALTASTLAKELLPHQKILALTFSNRSKQNLAARIREELGDVNFRRYVDVRNFHGHGAEIVRSHGKTLGISTEFEMPTPRTLGLAFRSYDADAESVALADGVLAALKRIPSTDAEIIEALEAKGNRLALDVETARQAAGAMHYGDLLRHAQRLLSVTGIGALYQGRYGAVLVDEFQDLSVQQLEIALNSSIGHRMFVGDPLQGIYSWAGAQPVEVEARLRLICGTPESLTTSYRSSPAVLRVLNGLTREYGASELLAADPDSWRDGGAAASFTWATDDVEAKYIVGACGALLGRNPELSIGVITRAAWRRKLIDAEFSSQSSINFIRWESAIDDARTVALLQRAVADLPRGAVVEDLKDASELLIPPNDPEALGTLRDAIELLANSYQEGDDLQLKIRQLQVRDPKAVVGPGVHLLNAHTGKGQQFDWVFMPGLEQGHLPSFLAKSATELSEEKRILLVMLSRARHGIVISRANLLTSKRNTLYASKLSPWWNTVATNTATSHESLKAHILATPICSP